MRKVIIGCILGSAFGFVLSTNGFTFLTWQFWVLLIILMLSIINIGIDER